MKLMKKKQIFKFQPLIYKKIPQKVKTNEKIKQKKNKISKNSDRRSDGDELMLMTQMKKVVIQEDT